MKSSVHSSVKDATSTVSPVVEIDPKEERALVWRLDIFFLTIGFLGYAFKYLDQTNISNAYVSGMETDLKLYGNELNYFTTFFKCVLNASVAQNCDIDLDSIGYMIMLYPSCIIVSHVGPSIWLPTCEVIWGVLTCCLSTVSNEKQWYLPHEMALRMSLYNIAQPVGAMLSGAMQGALSTNLDGALGRTGWRWAFIINPDRPNPLAKFYLRPRDIEVAEARTRRIGRDAQVGIQVKTFFRCFKFWHIWLFSIAWAIGSGITPSSYFNLWLKSLKNPDGTKRYSVAMLNYLPIAGQALQLVAELLFSGFSDYLGTRLPFLLLQSVISITSLIILIIRPGNEHAYMAGWYLNYVGAVSTMLLCAWASSHLENEPQVRTVLFATGTLLSYLFSAFLPIAAYPASEAPHWRIGAKLYLGLCSVAAVIYVTIFFMFKREARGKRRGPTQ
ncbi:unnamed protein product [Penicillium salamii]|uniref:Major facilitator superfamily transporter n=1 Tax=Penicillium salamii TaxID=1612424 RepID=A0A9W4JHY4_9EURO|nr:unnamed protein product [Penicillium salamii]CAG8186212.1 unnamed protein product [Penicillium salamii]CAG8400758.1 unnamed protein product [Penicillium salamii]CAG8406090.1 unnamed protein product [Penicillium salamii]CAG8664130.1 unnamed protein product [Penicillium salamii]